MDPTEPSDLEKSLTSGAKILPLRPSQSSAADGVQPNQEIIAGLEALLEQAKSAKLQGLLVIGLSPQAQEVMHKAWGNLPLLPILGALELLRFDIIRKNIDSPEFKR